MSARKRYVALVFIVLTAFAGVLAAIRATEPQGTGALAASGLPRPSRGPVTPAPKPNGLGTLSGVYDALLYAYNPTQGYYHCMIRLDHDSVTNAVKTASQCYQDIDLSDPHAEPRDSLPGEGPDLLPGLPPPPPYNWQPPSEGAGTYDPGSPGQRLAIATCLQGLGGSLGPNAIASILVDVPEAQLAMNGAMAGQVRVYPRQGSAQCRSVTPAGQSLMPWSIDLHPASDVNGAGTNYPAPWRTIGDTDFDNDGCADADELWTIKTPTAMCGDDPYSALDLSGGGSDVSGNYLLVATVSEADVCRNGSFGVAATPCSGADGSLVPGAYHTCLLDVQQAGKTLTAPIYCYIDSPSVAVNPQVAGAKSCPPADAGFCGDGLAGAAPPGRTAKPSGPINFGDVDDKQAVLTGQLDNSAGRLRLSGCIEDRDGMAAQGNVYVSVDVDAYTGQGAASIYTNETTADCVGGTPSGTAAPVPASLVRQATAAQQRDTDGDGCPDQRELSDSPQQGGLRDPWNHYDFFDPVPNGQVLVNDILAVVQQYFIDDPVGNPDLTSKTDRTALAGGNVWNLGPPDGLQRVPDILAVVKQYFDSCS